VKITDDAKDQSMKNHSGFVLLSIIGFSFGTPLAQPSLNQIIDSLSTTYDKIITYHADANVAQYSG
jgi:hypothetical protein